MKIFMNRKPVTGPWGGGNNFVKAADEYLRLAGHQVAYSLSDDVEVIIAVDPRYDELGVSGREMINFRRDHRNSRLIYRVNECDARKGDVEIIDPMIRQLIAEADHTVFVSYWLRDYHLNKCHKWKDVSVIYNGVGFEFKKSTRVPDGVTRIVTHHWSDNKMKGHDVYQFIDNLVASRSDLSFTYIGRSHGSLPNSTVIKPLQGKELAEKLSENDVYISGSRFDPGPNHIFESLACGLPTYAHYEGGGAAELVGKDHVFDLLELECLLLPHQKNFKKNEVSHVASWENCIEQYKRIIG